MLKFSLQLYGVSQVDGSKLTKFQALFDTGSSIFYEAFLLVLIFVQVLLLKKMGIFTRYLMDDETI
jgi:hypothetical protein